MIKHIKLNQDNLAFAIQVQNEIFPYEDATKEYTDMVNGQSDANFFLVYNGDDCIGVSGLKHYGIDVNLDDIIDNLKKGEEPYYENGVRYGGNIYIEFAGHPSRYTSFVTYDKTIEELEELF